MEDSNYKHFNFGKSTKIKKKRDKEILHLQDKQAPFSTETEPGLPKCIPTSSLCCLPGLTNDLKKPTKELSLL